ncbi:hypothetical protein AB0C02_27950 [Micromonospora sp. NPDC048999]|uniref:hypothetical protein n=1 Tax=Micromonospora sp. NPDC048999 TaxID=3155391 RepID=UPI003401A698
MLKSELTALLAPRRDNDVVIDVDGVRVPLVGVTYCNVGDQIVLSMDPAELDGAMRAAVLPHCRRCGCTEGAACPGGCAWASDEQQVAAGLDPMLGDVCTACVPQPVGAGS